MNYKTNSYKLKNGSEIKYAVFGTGKKIFVMIPGLSIKPVTESANLVAEAYDIFSEDFTLYLFDRTLPQKASTDIEKMSEELFEVLDALKIRDAYFFGASQGGMILQYLIINHPSIIKKAVLASTCGRTDENIDRKIGEWASLSEKKDVKALHLNFFENVYSEELLEALGEGIESMIPECTDTELESFYFLAKACKNFNAYERLHKTDFPVLVTGSEKDKIMSPVRQTELADKLNAEIYLYPSFSHAVYDEAPDFRQRLYDFFMK